jgi:ATP-dependent DNA ligase
MLPFVPPQIPTACPAPPTGSDWIHEIKHDGFRTVLALEVLSLTNREHVIALEARGRCLMGTPFALPI